MAGHDIIVMGASAGGIEAIEEIASHLPADLPAAVFIVIHISPGVRSYLPDILSRAGPLPAIHPKGGEPIRHGMIYVAPPDSHLLVRNGAVRLGRGPRENGVRPAVDVLFRSAALSHGTRVVGVVLSGGLDDGTAGLSAIKGRGGKAIVQDPKMAGFPSMPRSAIANVNVDLVLPTSEIGPKLVELAHAPAAPDGGPPMADEMKTESEMAELNADALGKRDRPGDASVFACPDCGGTLWEIQDGDLARFRCRVGHAYSPDTLLEKQSDSLEQALWTAIRGIEESKALSERLGKRARDRGDFVNATRYDREVNDAHRRAELIRQLLLEGRLYVDRAG